MKKFLAWHFPLSGKVSQSFEGEDILLWRLFTDLKIKDGFFIDVGAYHPVQFNNTWFLRRKLNFRGINIEPNKNGYKQFLRWRKDDINLNCLCGEFNTRNYYGYNTSDPALSLMSDSGILMDVVNLKTVCEKYKVERIDLLSIDVEGFELDVLRGHNWEIKPRVIICEINNQATEDFILKQGYKLYARTKRNGVYV